jgi:hypothetical protein
MSDELTGEIGRIHGIVFVDENGDPLPPYDPSKCPECGMAGLDGTWWDTYQFLSCGPYSMNRLRWNCPNGHTWVTI